MTGQLIAMDAGEFGRAGTVEKCTAEERQCMPYRRERCRCVSRAPAAHAPHSLQPASMGRGASRSALEGPQPGRREIVAEWFMLLVFGISAGSAVAALYARHEQ
jgi:hypothetical protein